MLGQDFNIQERNRIQRARYFLLCNMICCGSPKRHDPYISKIYFKELRIEPSKSGYGLYQIWTRSWVDAYPEEYSYQILSNSELSFISTTTINQTSRRNYAWWIYFQELRNQPSVSGCGHSYTPWPIDSLRNLVDTVTKRGTHKSISKGRKRPECFRNCKMIFATNTKWLGLRSVVFDGVFLKLTARWRHNIELPKFSNIIA